MLEIYTLVFHFENSHRNPLLLRILQIITRKRKGEGGRLNPPSVSVSKSYKTCWIGPPGRTGEGGREGVNG